MKGKKIPLNKRAEAVGIAVVAGIAEASRQTGISQPAISKWFHSPEFDELRARNKPDITAEWKVGVQKGFRRAVELLEHTDDPVKAATTAAIIFDKMALWDGEPTARTEMRTWTDGLDPDKQRRLRDWALDKLDELDGRGQPRSVDGDLERPGVRQSSAGEVL